MRKEDSQIIMTLFFILISLNQAPKSEKPQVKRIDPQVNHLDEDNLQSGLTQQIFQSDHNSRALNRHTSDPVDLSNPLRTRPISNHGNALAQLLKEKTAQKIDLPKEAQYSMINRFIFGKVPKKEEVHPLNRDVSFIQGNVKLNKDLFIPIRDYGTPNKQNVRLDHQIDIQQPKAESLSPIKDDKFTYKSNSKMKKLISRFMMPSYFSIFKPQYIYGSPVKEPAQLETTSKKGTFATNVDGDKEEPNEENVNKKPAEMNMPIIDVKKKDLLIQSPENLYIPSKSINLIEQPIKPMKNVLKYLVIIERRTCKECTIDDQIKNMFLKRANTKIY